MTIEQLQCIPAWAEWLLTQPNSDVSIWPADMQKGDGDSVITPSRSTLPVAMLTLDLRGKDGYPVTDGLMIHAPFPAQALTPRVHRDGYSGFMTNALATAKWGG